MNLHSPEKAALIKRHIERLRDIQRKPVCLAQGECKGVIGRSHTISKSQSLSLIAEDDHVLVRQFDLFASSRDNFMEPKRTSINEALAFHGFCKHHDNELFKSLDQSPFMATPEQIFMQAYRSACREYYFKACQIEAFPNPEQIAELQGLPQNEEYRLSPDLELAIFSMYQGLADIAVCKEKFEKLLSSSDYLRLRSHIIHFGSSPVIACAGSFFPDYLSNGKLLQDFADFDTRLQSLFISVIPDTSGIFVVFSFFDDEAQAPTSFIEDLIDTDKLTERLIWLCMTRSENLALKPSWWGELPDNTHNKISEAAHYNANLHDDRLPTFDRMPDLATDEWEVSHQFWI